MNIKMDKYLPIGTVVLLEGGTKRLMITGFCSIPGDEPDKIYDYTGCLYPEGFISSNEIALFNHDQIKEIYNLGLVDDEETKFKEELAEELDRIEQEENKTASVNTPNVDTPQTLDETPEVPVMDSLPSLSINKPQEESKTFPMGDKLFQIEDNTSED